MPKDLEVKTDSETLSLNGGTSTIVFTVNNGAGRLLRVRGEPRPIEKTQAGWLSVVDGDRKDLGSPGFQSFTVQVKPARDAEPGRYRFNFRAYDVDDPNEHWGESREITFEVPASPLPPPPPTRKWPWVVAAVVLLLIAGGVAVWLLTRGVPVPKLRDLTAADAASVLTKAGLHMKQPPTTRTSTEVQPGRVIDSDPPAGKKVGKGKEIAVVVAAAPAPPPPRAADKFVGIWDNPAFGGGTNGVVKSVTISIEGNEIVIQMIGRTGIGTETPWGTKRNPLSDAEDGDLNVTWDHPWIGGRRLDPQHLSVGFNDTLLRVQCTPQFDPRPIGVPIPYDETLKRRPLFFIPGILHIDPARVLEPARRGPGG